MSDCMGIIFNTRVAGVRVVGVGVRWGLARGGLTMGGGRVAVFWMWWRVCVILSGTKDLGGEH